MDAHRLKQILNDVKSGSLNIEDAFDSLKNLPYEDLDFAQIDHHRPLRKGFPEVIYCESKTDEQVVSIAQAMIQHHSNVLATRLRESTAEKLIELHPQFQYNQAGRIAFLKLNPIEEITGKVLIVAAGTSDLPIVEEAYITAEALGNNVEKIMDVGVAGIHRILDRRTKLEEANIIIVIAGMEGALASVVAGLVEKPIIAVPTSIGYGANFGGLSALLGMLNSCAPSVLTVNIDNGFGAAYAATVINKGMSS